ncbi:MAG: sorbosone dehydrogenase family protein [Fibrella sp.]|nr:sorbosone dehydrogenase family protein [Armatimonadota bacterium]
MIILGAGVVASCASGKETVEETVAEVTAPNAGKILTGAEAFGDWASDAPGVKRKITAADLPKPYATESTRNGPRGVGRPAGAMPKVPDGFTVSEFTQGLDNPRYVATAPNGDTFIVESNPGRVKVLRDTDGDGKADSTTVYAEGLKRPFGLAFYPANTDKPTHVYIANTDSVLRFAYQSGDTKATGTPETLVDNIPSGREQVGGGGHWTRDIAFSKDNKRMFVSVGSRSNVSDDASEVRRACILAFTPDGKNETTYAEGIRNPVGIAIDPQSGTLWTSVNERDELGDDLVPDYVTSVKEGGFYGWPWYYMGGNQDPRHAGKKPELKDSTIVPDVLLQPHMASLAMTFYTGQQFPKDYTGHIFAAQHGSWNRSKRVGYKVVRIPVQNGKAAGYYEDFLTGFVTEDGDVWGRPVGVAVAKDGALLVTDDQSGTVWRVAYKK